VTSANGFPDVAVFSLLVMPFDDNVLWAGTEIGIFVSEDGGLSWAFADNGLPAVAIFQMRIVDDEVLVATQGRGIWSVSLPELAGYEPPAVTLAPRLNALLMNPDGYLPVAFELRSAYDSTQVWVDGSLLTTLAANEAPAQESVNLPIDQSGTVVAQVVGFADGREYPSAQRSGRVYPVDVAAAYSNDFANPMRDPEFTGEGYRMTQPAGFLSRALHSLHPYRAGQGAVMQLKRPIRVQNSDATLQFSEVVLVEKGVASNWTDPNFWDYVIVEGTLDGANWIPLVDGYDSRANSAWSSRYDTAPTGDGGSAATGDNSLFVSRTINLLETFDPGDTIFIRFRLYSDPAVVAWGWAIDDLVIQPEGVRVEDERTVPNPSTLPTLAQNAPNPFNPTTEIAWSIPRRSRIELDVYDLAGRLVKRLVASEIREAGPHRSEWNGLDDQGRAVASGVYLYRLRTDEFERVRKMTLLK
jgi:hypothetical protein